jgi:TPR repeat protein
MNRLAGLYANGTGVTQDVVAAAGWYQRAAEHGLSLPAQIALGMMYEQGAGVRQSRTVASWSLLRCRPAGQWRLPCSASPTSMRWVWFPARLASLRAWAYAKQADDIARRAVTRLTST